jgi:hypothetical protein
MTDTIQRAVLALTEGRRMSLAEAEGVVPSVPGLYAFFTDEAGLRALDLKTGGPVYVGKAEKSLLGRDVRTHFATGKTGSSTLRRTLAALLRDELQLRAVPRSLSRPDGSANFAVEAAGDARLSAWMVEHLSLAVWPAEAGVVLDTVETAVLGALRPPLNLSKMGTSGSARIKAARAVMAAEARAWDSAEV